MMLKRLSMASVGLMAAVVGLGLAPTMAYADTNDFVFAGSGMTVSTPGPGGYATGQTVNISISVKEAILDQGGGENHPHALPPTIQFEFVSTTSTSTVTETGTLVSGGLYQADKLNEMYTATYSVTLPATAGTFKVTAPITMYQPHHGITAGTQVSSTNGSRDTDDPVGGSASVTITTTTTQGNLPEVPYAALMPGLLLAGYAAYRYSKKFRGGLTK